MSQKCQELVDSEVINLVPMLVQNVDTSLEPLHFMLDDGDAFHDLADLHRSVPLIDRLIRMPKH